MIANVCPSPVINKHKENVWFICSNAYISKQQEKDREGSSSKRRDVHSEITTMHATNPAPPLLPTTDEPERAMSLLARE